MRIVSLNAWGGALWPALRDWLIELDADVLCLQEVTRRLRPGPDEAIYADPFRRLDQRTDLFRDVGACRPGDLGRFAPATRGPLQDADGAAIWTEHGLGTWVAPRLAQVASLDGFVHGDFRPDGFGPEPVPRRIQVTRIARAGQAAVTLGHVHGLRDPGGKGDTPARAAQARAIVAALDAVRRAGDVTVLMGDLNLLEGSASFDILASAGLQVLNRAWGISDTRTAHYPKDVRVADYALCSDRRTVLCLEAPALPEVSDHRPLVLTLGPPERDCIRLAKPPM